MVSLNYELPSGIFAIPENLLDLRSDSEIDHDLLHPGSVLDEKNIWFFWHSGYKNMYPYTQRNVRSWHRRFSFLGWKIRVLDRVTGSPLNVANYLDVSDIGTFPRAFIDGSIGGEYALQHMSDLVRFPLLVKYGGVYADVGLMQIGNLDRLWCETVGNPVSPFDIISYNMGDVGERALTNFFLACNSNNPFFLRCHQLLLKLWAADGGKQSTEGMHSSPLLKGVALIGKSVSFKENSRTIGPEEASKILTDYIIQGQVITMVMGLVDEEGGWDGPKYCAEHVYAIEYMVGSQLINQITGWDGLKAFHLMSLSLPRDGQAESSDQKQAFEIVVACLQKSFGFKLAHGIIVKIFGETLGSLWKKNEGSDNIPGTYAHLLRHGIVYWCQDGLPSRLNFQVIEPFKRGPLLREK